MFTFDRMHDNFWGGSMLFTGFLWMILLALLIAVLVILFTRLFSSMNSGGDKDNSMNILKERYASGEITEEEYDKRRKKLKDG